MGVGAGNSTLSTPRISRGYSLSPTRKDHRTIYFNRCRVLQQGDASNLPVYFSRSLITVGRRHTPRTLLIPSRNYPTLIVVEVVIVVVFIVMVVPVMPWFVIMVTIMIVIVLAIPISVMPLPTCPSASRCGTAWGPPPRTGPRVLRPPQGETPPTPR